MRLPARAASRILASAALTCAAVALPVTALAASGHAARTTTVRACTAAHTTIWLGLGAEARDTLTVNFFHLEFSNTGRSACDLFGYPGVSVISSRGHQIGPAASHSGTRRLVVLQPGGTAHVVVTYLVAGFHCSGGRLKTGDLNIFAPGERKATIIGDGFTVQVCTNKVVLHVDAVHAGAGVPGFSTS